MTAPTTAEVRERIERLRHERDARMTGERAKTVSLGEVASMSAYALPLAEERDAERARAEAAEAESARRGELLAAERERYVALQCTLNNERHAAMDKSAALMAAEAEVAALRSVLHSIATLDDDDPEVVLLDDWDVADVYGSLRAAITSARMALAAKGEGR